MTPSPGQEGPESERDDASAEPSAEPIITVGGLAVLAMVVLNLVGIWFVAEASPSIGRQIELSFTRAPAPIVELYFSRAPTSIERDGRMVVIAEVAAKGDDGLPTVNVPMRATLSSSQSLTVVQREYRLPLADGTTSTQQVELPLKSGAQDWQLLVELVGRPEFLLYRSGGPIK